MEQIHLIGAEGIDPKKIEQLERDIKYLLAKTYIRREIAEKMNKDEGNMSKILTGNQSVSHAFIEDFYRIFGPELPDKSELNEDPGEYGQTRGSQEPTLADVITILQRIESKIDGQDGSPDKKN